MKPSEIIREARNLLFERGWTRSVSEAPDGSMCMVGALNAALGYSPSRTCIATHVEAIDTPVKLAIGGQSIFLWNDAYGRTFDEVIAAFDKAEKLAEAAEDA